VPTRDLSIRTLAGPFRKGVRLYPIDLTDPLAFEAVYEGQPFRAVFERGADRWGICWWASTGSASVPG
jgi:hypothetical protein